jgi:TatD DNase family protein
MARAAARGVDRLIVTGTTVAASAAGAALADAHPGALFATAGIHPHHAAELDADALDALRSLLEHPRVVAVGECGLDFFRDFALRPAQEAAFRAQLELAAAAGKPVFLHQRDAHARFVALLEPAAAGLQGGVAHCFTGGVEELRAYLDLGLHVGVTGWLCDERRGQALREALPHVPLERLLLETDAPYLLPRDLAPRPPDRRNEPQFLRHIAERAAEIMGVTLEAIAAASTRNAERLFGV